MLTKFDAIKGGNELNWKDRIKDLRSTQSGSWGIMIEDPQSGETYEDNAQGLFSAASVIKVPIMMEIYRQDREKSLSLDDILTLKAEEVVGGCGVLQVLHLGINLTIRDVVALMITVSDNTATNMMIEKAGIDSINTLMRSIGMERSILRRKLMMPELARQGIRNEITAWDIVLSLKSLDNTDFLDKDACNDMIGLLKMQQLNHKIPLMLPSDAVVAHKTGEDTGITHNAGIIYANKKRFYMCVLSEGVTDIPSGHRFIAEIARICYDAILAE
jgi:beta-lactamase class A